MINDPITEAIRAIRRDLAAQCGNDVATIFAEVRRREALDGRVYITLPKDNGRLEMAEHDGQLKRR